ncbi:ATP-grasp domain-containing protein [Candidatus Nanohalobium constans]|uniref:Ribosomal protein S6--L-glutamate ligase n=1 Tax=Candidatus Nanohalobium constans TaxID=2565781 RepID=A0A5Q0UHJ3_9ARCH|nr:ATP-grasp domain-containing protein [Candidatus Nanohalobium constans]QGA80670.1 ribosomal protein S6--L-glutamate ligase [Candidatus Nanohalobium constans]
MKLGIIYGEISTKHQLLMERAEEIFDSVLAAPIEGIKFVHGEEEEKVLYKDTDLTEFDAVYIRTADNDMMFSEHLVEVLNESGVVTQAENDTYAYESNKFYSMKILAENGVNVPDSIYTLSPEVAVESARELGYPVIMKTVRGAGGEGVMRATSENELKPVMDTMKSFEQEICLQEFKEHGGKDTRVTKIGDYITGYSRSSSGDEWRSNISGGGDRVKANITDEMKQVAFAASASMGFDICGADIIGEEEPYVLEVNGSFGISEEMNQLIGEDVILRMVERMHERAMEKQAH